MTRLTLSRLLPAAALAFALADLGLRFVPIGSFAFRGWEALANPNPVSAPFLPNRTFRTDRSYGDLSSMSNRRAMRVYRPETFTTDELGFRNPPGFLRDGPPDLLVLGDSFTAGAALSDDETIASQLRAAGRRTYAVTGASAEARHLPAALDRIGFRRGTAVILLTDRLPWVLREDDTGLRPLEIPGLDRAIRTSRLRILTQRALRTLRDGEILPNPDARAVSLETLRDGRPFLFQREQTDDDTGVGAEVQRDAMLALDAVCRARGLRLVVLAVPHKWTVYGPLAAGGSRPVPPSPSPRYAQVLPALRAAGIEVIDATDALRAAAAAETVESAAAGRFVYVPDDSHWGPTGVAVAVRLLLDHLAAPR